MKFLIDKNLKCGVYKITNTINNKFYIGSTKGLFKNRYFAHRTELRYNRHANKHLQNSWNKYGENSFEFSLIEICSVEQCFEREQYYFDTLFPQYNIIKYSNCGILGYKHTEETKKKIGDIQRGRLHPAFSGEHVFYHKNFGFVILGMCEISKKYEILDTAVSKLKNEEIGKYNGWIYIGKHHDNFIYPDNIDEIYENKIDNRPVYVFYHKHHGKYLGHIKEFCEKYKIKRCNIKRLTESIDGNCSINGWISFGKKDKDFMFPKNVKEIYEKTLKKNNRNKNLSKKYSTFQNINGETFNGSLEEFSKKYNLHLGCVIRLYNGGRKRYKKWSVKN